MSTQTNQVQLDMFSRGTPVNRTYAQAVAVTERYVKKDKAVVKDKDGNPIVGTQTIRLLPAKSKTKEDLADLFQKSGQPLKLEVAQLGRELLKSGSAHMSALIASGDYTFDVASVNLRNGKFMLRIKPEIGRPAILTPDQLERQAAALGYSLVPKEEPQKELPEGDGEDEPTQANGKAEVVIESKTPKAKKKTSGKKAAVIEV